MKILLDSGIMSYINILFFITLGCAFFTSIIGFVFFIFFLISFLSMYFVFYCFRLEDRIINHSSIVSCSDGKITEIRNFENLPDIINNHDKYHNYQGINIYSGINNIYFKHSPCDGVIEDIQFYEPRSINKNSNFPHKKHHSYVVFTIVNKKQEKIFLIIEYLFIDQKKKSHNLYVNIKDEINKGDLLICTHFFSNIWLLIPSEYKIKVCKNQSLLYNETSII